VKIIQVVDVCSSQLPIFGGVRNHKSVGPIAVKQDRTRLKSGKDYEKEIKIQVPSVIPSYLRHCNIISVGYKVEFQVRTPIYSKDMTLEVPIVVGLIPATSSSDDNSALANVIYAGHSSVKVRDSRFDEGDKEYTPCYHFYSNPAFFNDDQNPPGSDFYSKDKMVTAI